MRLELLYGEKALKNLRKSRVVIVGCGALGSRTAEALARLGVKLFLVDMDVVGKENLETQLYYKEDIGKPKASALANRLSQFTKVKAVVEELNQDTVRLLDRGLVVDGTDNFETRFLINDYCVKNNKAWVFGAVLRNQGMAALFKPTGPCYSCVFSMPKSFQTCDTVGVSNEAAAIVSSIQSSLAVKHLLGKRISQELIVIDLEKYSFEKIKMKKNRKCKPHSGKFEYLDKPVSEAIK